MIQKVTALISVLGVLACFSLFLCSGGGFCSAVPAGENPGMRSSLWQDGNRNGWPDGLELHGQEECFRFRRWFTFIAEAQFYRASLQWHAGQRDCAGLVRFAWREALRSHDRFWFQKMGIEYEPVAPDVKAEEEFFQQFQGRLFRVREGSCTWPNLRDGSFSDFADARALKNYNCRWIARDWRQARPGDLLFFSQPWVQKYPLHIMIYLGASTLKSGNANDWVVYHTGESEAMGGEVRKVQLSVLEQHPDPRWRPLGINRHYQGVFRLKLLGD